MPTAFPVVGYKGKLPTTPDAMRSEEAAALAEIYSLATESQRSFLRERLESPDLNINTSIASVPDSPRVAELLGKIYAIRSARIQEAYLADQRKLATLSSTQVLVAVLPSSRKVSFDAAVIRRTGPAPMNRIILSSGSATPETLTNALRVLARSRLRHGELPTKPIRIDLRPGPVPPMKADQRAFSQAVISSLAGVEEKVVPGYGKLKSVTIDVGPVQDP